MKRFYALALLMCLYGLGFSQLDCSTFTARDAKETALFLYLPTYTGCSTEPTYDISYRPTQNGGGAWTPVNQVFYYPNGGPYNSFFFFGLTACTEYEVRVQVYCNGVPVGECIEIFSTEGCEELDCNDVSIGNIGTTTADITLSNQSGCTDPVTGEITYDFRLKKSTDPWGSFNQGQTTGTINLTGLDACTDYDYEIRLICNGAPTTVCTGSFTTVCGSCDDVDPINITDTSADITLNGFDDCKDGGTLYYEIEIRESGGSWTTISNQSSTTNVHSLTGLDPCTVYEYRITIKCNDNEVTCSGTFTTTGCEVYPCDGVTVPYVNNSIAYIQFTGFEDCQLAFGTYSVQYWVYNHTTGIWVWNSSNLGQNYFVLQNLDPCTEYTVELSILCDGVYTKPCTLTFTTTGNCLVSSGGGSSKTDLFSETPVSAYPNPFTEGLNLEFGLESAEEVTVVLHDVLGKEVYRHTGLYQAGLNKLAIDGRDLPSGLLLYTLQTSSNKKSGRVIKQ